MALGHKNAFFAGNDGGGHTWGIVQSLAQTCKLNGIEPVAYLTDVLERITSGEAKTTDLKALLPWNWPGAGVPLR
jgi:hypothetical protein